MKQKTMVLLRACLHSNFLSRLRIARSRSPISSCWQFLLQMMSEQSSRLRPFKMRPSSSSATSARGQLLPFTTLAPQAGPAYVGQSLARSKQAEIARSFWRMDSCSADSSFSAYLRRASCWPRQLRIAERLVSLLSGLSFESPMTYRLTSLSSSFSCISILRWTSCSSASVTVDSGVQMRPELLITCVDRYLISLSSPPNCTSCRRDYRFLSLASSYNLVPS